MSKPSGLPSVYVSWTPSSSGQVATSEIYQSYQSITYSAPSIAHRLIEVRRRLVSTGGHGISTRKGKVEQSG